VCTCPVITPTSSPPNGTTNTARPSTNHTSTPPNALVSYFFACASLYLFASSTQHSRPSAFFLFAARGGAAIMIWRER
jgi:hypothetical protein